MSLNTPVKNLRATERGINKNLFLVTVGVTIVSMTMMTLAFFSRGSFPSDKMGMFYLGVVIVYSFHKELLRWLGEDHVERQGEYFIYGWIGLTTSFYVIDFLTKGHFSLSAHEEEISTIRETASLTIEVLIIFVLTRGLKILKLIWQHRGL